MTTDNLQTIPSADQASKYFTTLSGKDRDDLEQICRKSGLSYADYIRRSIILNNKKVKQDGGVVIEIEEESKTA